MKMSKEVATATKRSILKEFAQAADLHTRIHEAEMEYLKTARGIEDRPTKLYLGSTESLELKDEARRLLFYRCEKPILRPQYNGMDVYRVDAHSYVAVGG